MISLSSILNPVETEKESKQDENATEIAVNAFHNEKIEKDKETKNASKDVEINKRTLEEEESEGKKRFLFLINFIKKKFYFPYKKTHIYFTNKTTTSTNDSFIPKKKNFTISINPFI